MRTAAVALLCALVLTACGGSSEDDAGDEAPSGEASTGEASSGPRSPAPASTASPTKPKKSSDRGDAPTVVDTVVTGLAAPWGLDFLPDGTALVTERDTARVLAIEDGKKREVGRVDQASPRGESGLLGIAISPDFEDDATVFLYVTTAEDNRIVKTTYDGKQLGELEPILTGIPNGFIHDGGRLEFGPDGHLFASTGEIGEAELAQDRSSLAGKILRITPDGDPAPGNPDPDSPVWSWGHRNVQGLAFDDTGQLWASEFGAQDFDELNRIEEDGNYGWPRFEGTGGTDDFIDPHVVWRTFEASPSGLAWADGRLWMASLRGERLWRVDVEDGRAVNPRDFFVGDHGRLRTVVPAPDGTLWLTTSNRDTRGEPKPGDDRILVIRP